MRRALYVFAVVMLGAAATAPAQARSLTVARLVLHPTGAPTFATHVSNLLDDPDWQERWGQAFFIQLHWKAQIWRDRLFGSSQPAVEWDVCVQQVPGLDLFTANEPRGRGRATTTFRTLDSLRAHLNEDVGLPQPQLAPGNWIYLIDVHISTSEEDPCDPRTAPARAGFLERLVQGSGPVRDLPQFRLPFTVR